MRFPAFVSSFSCLARARLCIANASRGEYSGGTSPATWIRGDRRGRDSEACDWDRRSRKSGRWPDMVEVDCCVSPQFLQSTCPLSRILPALVGDQTRQYPRCFWRYPIET